jgi:DNA-directed RNA polymerase specialized sigma24 family protein
VRSVISLITAEADRGPKKTPEVSLGRKPPQAVKRLERDSFDLNALPAHQCPAKVEELSHFSQIRREVGHPEFINVSEEEITWGKLGIDEYERRVYRNRTVSMLRRYLRCSLETGRLPSLLGSEFFRAKTRVSARVTFEDRIIFVHDMENCLQQLDEFSQRLIARHILQEHDCENTARLLKCNEKTVRRLMPLALDRLSEMLLERGLMEKLDPRKKKSCQEGEEDEIELSHWEDDENKF